MGDINKDDLKQHTEDIKEHISILLAPINKDVDILKKNSIRENRF